MKFFKTKEEKHEILLKELKKLNDEYKDIFNKHCMIGKYVFLFQNFEIDDNRIKICFKDSSTPKNRYSLCNYTFWKSKYDTNLMIAYNTFLNFQHQLSILGLEIIKTNV